FFCLPFFAKSAIWGLHKKPRFVTSFTAFRIYYTVATNQPCVRNNFMIDCSHLRIICDVLSYLQEHLQNIFYVQHSIIFTNCYLTNTAAMKNFSINHRRAATYDVLELSGELDAHTASQLENTLKRLINQKQHHIIVNCKELDYIASAGLGVFMAYIEDVRAQGGDIKLTDMNPKVYDVFDLLGFPALYDIVQHEEEAIQKFETGESE